MSNEMPSLSTKILIEIRDEMKATRRDLSARLDATNERLDVTNARLDTTNERLDLVARRQTESEVRISTELVALGAAVERLTQAYRADRTLQSDVADLKHRVGRLEGAR